MEKWRPPSKVNRITHHGRLVLTALLGAVLFAGCASTPPSGAAASPASNTPAVSTASPSPQRKGNLRTVGVVFRLPPQLAMRAYEKDQGGQAVLWTVIGVVGGLGAGIAGTYTAYFAGWMLEYILLAPLAVLGYMPQPPQVVTLSPEVLLTTSLIGGGIGLIASVVKSVPATRVAEIQKAVFPALSDFPLQKTMVEQIVAAGTDNAEYSFVVMDLTEPRQGASEEVDATLEVGALNVALQKAGNGMQLSATVQAQLIEKGTGASIAQKTFSHTWRTFGRDRPGAGDASLTGEEINGCLRMLSEDVLDTLLRTEDVPTLYSVGQKSAAGLYSDGLQPVDPKWEYQFLPAKWKPPTVDTLQPRLEWVPFPSKKDRELDTKGRLDKIGPVSYDLRIWKLADEMLPWELVYERRELVDPWHTVGQPLENGTTYYWAVRARFVREGHAAVTQWTTCPGFLPLITREEITKGGYAFSFSTAAWAAKQGTTAAESGTVTLPGAAEVPVASIRIDGSFEDWKNLPPAFIGEGRSGNLHMGEVYLARDNENLYLKVSVNDATPASFFHPDNFDRNSSYGLEVRSAKSRLFMRVFWKRSMSSSWTETQGWSAEVLRTDESGRLSLLGAGKAAVNVKSSTLEASFNLEALREGLGCPKTAAAHQTGAVTGVFVGVHDQLNPTMRIVDSNWQWDSSSGERTDWKELVF
jgi:hypothetical protein